MEPANFMIWIVTTFLALGGMIILDLVWRRRRREWKVQADHQLNTLARAAQSASLHAQAQQEAVFNSMIEGVVLLDGRARIQLANRRFNSLFGIGADPRGPTLLEATRMHELRKLIEGLNAETPVKARELRVPGLDER